MGFSIEQVIGLSKQGFSAEQIKAFEGAITPTQPVQQMPQAQPVQQVQPVQQMTQVQPVQQVQQMPQVQPVQQMSQVQPVQPVQPAGSATADTSLQMLNLVKMMQEQALASATGQSTQPQTAVDAGLNVLGRENK